MNSDAGRSWTYFPQALGQWFDDLAAGGIFMTDAAMRIRAWNRWLEAHTGRLAGEIIGTPLFDAFPELIERGFDQLYRDALAGEARVVAQRFHGYLLPVSARSPLAADRLPGGFMPQSARIAPLRASGEIVGTITVIENVTERVMSERELRNQIAELERARATAEAAVRTKDEFLATLSHELRTPLNAVLGWARLMRTGQVESSTFSRALEVIERNATAQAQLIDDLLDVARIMQGKLRLDMSALDLVPIVLAAVDVIRPSAEAKRLRLTTRIGCESAGVIGDPNRLQQVIWNLLANAVKFTDPDGRIDVLVRDRIGMVEIVVSDTGRGIAPAFLPFVFDRFRQEDATTTRVYGGLGLGLSLVRQLVELHGGAVRAESPGEGEGATFIVSIPMRETVTTASVVPIRPLAASRDGGDRHRILVVDDEADARELLSETLRQQGATVIAVGSSAEAFRVLCESTTDQMPHLIVADIAMPGEDGYALMQRVRALPPDGGGRIPAIAVTGYAGPDHRQRALTSGFQVHLSKPVHPNELEDAIRQLLDGHPTDARDVPGVTSPD